MRLIKKLSMLLAFSAPLAFGCGSNNSTPQPGTAPAQQATQPLLPTPTPPVPPPPSSPPGAPVVALIQNWMGPSTGFTITVSGTNIPANPTVTFTSPSGHIIPAAFVMRDQNNPSQLLIGVPNIQAIPGETIGLYGLNITDLVTGQTATGPSAQTGPTVLIRASSFSFGVSNYPNSSIANHLGTGMDADPIALALGDLTGDGTPDLVTANHDDESVSILLRGPGVNQNYAVRNLPVGIHVHHPRAVALGDFTGDHKLDIMAFDDSSTTASELINQGAGGFAASQNVPAVQVSSQSAAAVADFNLDGKPDVAVVGSGTPKNLHILYGNADLSGTFASKEYSHYLPNSYALVAGQMSNDATRASIALINATSLQVLVGEADPVSSEGHFTGATPVDLDGTVSDRDVAATDLNGDGELDFFVTKAHGHSEIEAVLSDASGGVWSSTDAVAGGIDRPRAITVGDLNGDGIPDLAAITDHDTITITPGMPCPWHNVPSSVGSNTNLDPLRDRCGKFDTSKAQVFKICDEPTSIKACDVDGNGLLDLAITCKAEDVVQVLTNTSL